MSSEAVRQEEQPVPPGSVLRYTFRERAIHWTAGFSYLYLLCTGLAFWSPWLFWLAVVFGGGQISRTLHPWVGLIFSVAVCFMYSVWAPQMHFTDLDGKWFKAIRFYITNQDEKMPPAGRYNAGQKALFWFFFYGGLLLLLSGLILWFTESLPWSWRYLRYAAILVHASVALLSIGNFMIHVYMGVFAERGALNSVIRGWVTLNFVKRFHPGWYKELIGESSAANDLSRRE